MSEERNENGLRIIELRAENVKGLKAVEIKPDGDMVLIAGSNGAGKSSVIDSIAYALGGKGLHPDKPIRDGQETAEVTLDLDGYIVTRRWWYKKGTRDLVSDLKVVSDDGGKYGQDFLNKLIGELSFDPLDFQNKQPKDQRDLLLSMVDLSINLDEFAEKRKELVTSRTNAKNDVMRLTKELEESEPPEEGLPTEKHSLTAITEEIESFDNLIEERRDRQRAIDDQKNGITNLEADIKGLEETLEERKAALRQMEIKLHDMQIEYDTEVDSELDASREKLKAMLSTAEDENEKIQEAHAYNRIDVSLGMARGNVNSAHRRIADLDQEKLDALTSAKFPILNLSISDTGVLYKGRPLDQASGSEQLRVSIALAMALNPELRVICTKNGNDLDKNGLKMLQEMAPGYQKWIERIEGGPAAIYIEDGTLATSQPGAAGADEEEQT